MKNLLCSGFSGIILFVFVASSHAQKLPPLNEHISDKPSLFSALPEKFECSLPQFEKIFTAEITQKIKLNIHPSFQTDAIILKKIQKSKDLLSINIELLNYNNALFTISSITEKGVISYAGRIFNNSNGDVLILSKEGDKYFFIKQQQKFTMVE